MSSSACAEAPSYQQTVEFILNNTNDVCASWNELFCQSVSIDGCTLTSYTYKKFSNTNKINYKYLDSILKLSEIDLGSDFTCSAQSSSICLRTSKATIETYDYEGKQYYSPVKSLNVSANKRDRMIKAFKHLGGLCGAKSDDLFK